MRQWKQCVMRRIQIGRGVAATLVVMYHANLYHPSVAGGIMLGGLSGVDFFFVLSGFLISFIHADDVGRPHRLPPYALKRLRRVFPVYWIYTAGVLLLNTLVFTVTGKQFLYWTALDPSSVLSSMLLWPTDLATDRWPIIAVAWTLSYEMLFYVLFGVAILTGGATAIAGVCIWVLLIVAATWGSFGQIAQPFATLLGSHNLEFLVGCGIGLYLRDDKRPRPNSKWLAATGVAILAVAWWNALAGYPLMPRIDAVQFGFPYALIIFALATMDLSVPLRNSPTTSFLSFLGDASYSIYLVHSVPMFLWAIVANDLGLGSDHVVWGAILLGVASGVSAYVIIERPLLTWLRTSTSARRVNPSI